MVSSGWRHPGGPARNLRLAFLLELVPALLVGWLLGRRWPGLPGRLAPPLVQWGVPFSLMGLLLRGGLHWSTGQVGVLALLAVALGLLLVRWFWSDPICQLAGVVGNTAYFGIPATLALLPPQAVGYAISYDLAATLFTWTLGPQLLAGQPLALRSLLQALVASPASRGLLGAALLQLSPWAGVLAGWLWWPARVVVLLSLAVVGMRLAQVRQLGLPWRLLPVLACKLVLFPLVLLAVSWGLGLSPLVRSAVVLQAAAPTAISVLLLAEARAAEVGSQASTRSTRSEPGPATALVFWSTLLALLTVPFWARLLVGPALAR